MAISSVANINDNLIAYYPFNGNVNDESGNGNNGTVYGAILTEDRFGNPNSAYDFNGINANVQLPINVSNLFNINDPITFSLWFKTTTTSTNYQCTLMCK